MKEAADTVKAYTDNIKLKERTRAMADYELAQLIAFAFHAPKDMPAFDEYFPGDRKGEDAFPDSNWMLIREQMRAAAEYNNGKRGGTF